MSWPYSLYLTLKKYIFSLFARFTVSLLVFKAVHTISIEKDYAFIWEAEIYPPYTFSRVWSTELEMKRFPNFYKIFKGFSKFMLYKKYI